MTQNDGFINEALTEHIYQPLNKSYDGEEIVFSQRFFF